MIQIIPANQRAFNDHGWLKTYLLFSFDQYYDPRNIHFGNLRVFNDDTIIPNSGFGTHPHREMEIVTIILNGTITHRDSMGNETKITKGEVQRMTAGTGITHSEHNLDPEELHLYQIWFLPRESRLKPSYEQFQYNPADRKNRLHKVVSGSGEKGHVTIHSDADIYLSDLDSGNSLAYPLGSEKGLFLYVTSGILSVNGQIVAQGDQARIDSEPTVTITAEQDAEFILIDVTL